MVSIGLRYKLNINKQIQCNLINGWVHEDKIVNHSKNIIDLIQAGDFVNKKLVSNVDKIDNTNIIEWEDGEMYSTSIENDKFIKEILTKEQYSQNSYKVVE